MLPTLLYTGAPIGLLLAAALSILTAPPLSATTLDNPDAFTRARLLQLLRPTVLVVLAALCRVFGHTLLAA